MIISYKMLLLYFYEDGKNILRNFARTLVLLRAGRFAYLVEIQGRCGQIIA